jgi:hypothetical protein
MNFQDFETANRPCKIQSVDLISGSGWHFQPRADPLPPLIDDRDDRLRRKEALLDAATRSNFRTFCERAFPEVSSGVVAALRG